MKTFQSAIVFKNAGILLTLLIITAAGCKKDASVNKSVSNIKANDQVNESINLASGLVAWYPFNGNTLDSSGNGNDVIFNSAVPTKGKNGLIKNAYLFDGTSSFMKVANSVSINPSSAITLYALIKPKGFYQGACHGNRVISKGYNDYAYGRYDLGFDDAVYYNFNHCNQVVQTQFQKFYGTYGNGQAGAPVIGGYANTYIKVNNWYKVTCTFGNGVGKIYINGVQKGSFAQNILFTPNSNDLFFGRNEDVSYPYYFNGIIDEIKIFNRALSKAEVAAL